MISTTLIGLVAAVSVPVAKGIHIIYRKMRNQDITNAFVYDLATNHMPYLQDSITKIADKLNVELDAAPPIHYVRLNGHKED